VNNTALLLAGSAENDAADRLGKILAFFGVPCERAMTTEFFRASETGSRHVLGTAEKCLELVAALEQDPGIAKTIRSVFVIPGNNPDALQKLVRKISRDNLVRLVRSPQAEGCSVTDKLPEFCRSMSDLRIEIRGVTEAAVLEEAGARVEKIIFTKTGAAFARLEFLGLPVFVCTANVLDVSAPLGARDFDIRVHLLNALPAVLFVKWAFADTSWQPAEICACLVIDDPRLTPRYGFLDFEKLLGLMHRLNFSTSIAFIPWNWNRDSHSTVELFRKNSGRYSLSIHGCDHSDGEYGCPDHRRLAWKSWQALDRMERHRERTGLPHDRVMVFPQGVFCRAAMDVLKRAGFMATVNSDVLNADPEPSVISVSDYWSVALMNYATFPMFTRRAPWLGVENFAFDILLGKPCLLCTHHNDFHDDFRHVVEFMERLNRLNVKMRWTNLAEVVRRSVRRRNLEDGLVELEIFSSEAHVENNCAQKKKFRIHKCESTPGAIREIRVDGQPVKWTVAKEQVAWEMDVDPGVAKKVEIIFRETVENDFPGDRLGYRAKVLARRYLCEFRDNYVKPKFFSE
jgi:hypothetical protein